MEGTLKFTYKNWRDEISVREVIPINIFYGTTPLHKGPQWFMKAQSLDKKVVRDYAMKDMSNVEIIPVMSALDTHIVGGRHE